MNASKVTQNIKKKVDDALCSGNPDTVVEVIRELLAISSMIENSFQKIELSDEKTLKEFMSKRISMPGVIHIDKRLNENEYNRAERLALGTKTHSLLNRTGARGGSLNIDIIVNALHSCLEYIRKFGDLNLENSCKFGLFPPDVETNALVLAKIARLPDLNINTINEWAGVMFYYCTLWGHLEESENDKYYLRHSAMIAADAAKSYMESRLRSRRKSKINTLEKSYPDGHLYSEDDAILDKEVVYFTQYVFKKQQIDSMKIDFDCYKYGITRLFREKLKMLL